MRVIFVNPAAGLGGSERSLLDILASLGRTALAVDKKVVLFADGELVSEIRKLNVDVSVLPAPREIDALGESAVGDGATERWGLLRAVLDVPSFALSLRRMVRDFRADLVHTNGMKAHVMAALAVPDVPRLVHLRDFIGARRVSRYLLPLIGQRALVVANSEAVREDALALNAELDVRVVHNAIDLEEFRPRARELGGLAAASGLDVPPEHSVVVGLVATYAFWKGHRTFIEAAARLRQALPDSALRFYIVGGPVYRTAGSQITETELRHAVERAGLSSDVGLVPFQHNVARVYQGLDVVVQASERPEPFGRTIVEAMASGRAVVVARAGGATELFTERQTGLGFRPGDPADLARAVAELVGDATLRQRIAMAARTEAALRFGHERLAGQIYDAYEALLRNV
jgi:glycosyltransferase involved in cell wall biosynthesis